MGGQPRRPGPQLPYRPLAGVQPCPGGWLVASGKLQGISLHPAEAMVLPTLVEVLDYRPSFEIIALHAPIGLPSKPQKGGRACDREAREVLGWPHSGAILSAPSRPALAATTFEEAGQINEGLSAVLWSMFPHIAEVDREIQPYTQRRVFEVHPELSFFQIGDDVPLQYAKHTEAGRNERRALLERRLPGVDKLFNPVEGARIEHALDAAACLWTARRIASKAVVRLPLDPEWDDLGLRMEYVR